MADPTFAGRQFLIVDADAAFRAWAEGVLSGAGAAEVRAAASGAEGLRSLREFVADAVLTDTNLPDMTGTDFLWRLRDKRFNARYDVPVMLIAAAADREALMRACRLGIESFARKPTTEDVLLKRLERALALRRRFVISPSYFGPDRRAGQVPFEGPERRRPLIALAKAQAAGAPSGNRPVAGVVMAGDAARRPKPKAPAAPTPASAAPQEPADAPIAGSEAAAEAVPAVPATKPAPVEAAAPAAKPAPIKVAEPAAKPAREPIEAASAPAAASPKPAKSAPIEPKPAPAAKREPAAIEARDAPPPAPKPEDKGPDVEAVLDGHGQWLKSRGAAGQRASLEGADLGGRDFAGANLSQASLRQADFSDSNLTGANLQGADLRSATFANATLADADLGVAKLRHAKTLQAVLDRAKLRGANLSGADLRGASLKEAEMASAILVSTNLSGSDMTGARGLTQGQANRAIGDAKTVWPAGVRSPQRDDTGEVEG